MESLSVVLKSMLDPDYVERAEQRGKQILADPLLTEWRSKFPEVSDGDLKRNLNRCYQYISDYHNCSNCPGLELCPNDMEGYYTVLTADTTNGETYIYDHKTACRKMIAWQAQNAVRGRIRSFYVDEISLHQSYSAEEIMRADPARMKAVRSVMEYIIKTKKEGLQRKGLYLAGNFGTGKTFLMCYLLHELAEEGLSGAIVYMPDFAEDLKAMFQDPQKLKETIDLLKNTDLLVFDDIGSENLNPWLRDHVLGTILNYRMNRKPTFFTSNHELDALQQHFSFTNKDGEEESRGQRIMERVRPFVDVVIVKGRNKRGV